VLLTLGKGTYEKNVQLLRKVYAQLHNVGKQFEVEAQTQRTKQEAEDCGLQAIEVRLPCACIVGYYSTDTCPCSNCARLSTRTPTRFARSPQWPRRCAVCRLWISRNPSLRLSVLQTLASRRSCVRSRRRRPRCAIEKTSVHILP
jgi:hypothetical protein